MARPPAPHQSDATDPDRTWAADFCCGARADLLYLVHDPCLGVSPHEAPRLHHAVLGCSGRMAARGSRAAGGCASDRIYDILNWRRASAL
jgi:hypothetical protein